MTALRSAAFTAIVLLAFLAVTELVLRTTHWFGARVSWSEPDARIGYRYTPGRPYWHFEENDHPITGRINSFGWRDRERSLTKPEGCYRIAVLGDSQVEAFPVELDSSFCALVERRFAGEGMTVELLNLGRSSMTTTEQLLILETDVFPFSPDAILLFFMPVNDVADVRPETAGSRLRPFFTAGDDGSLVLDDGFTRRRAYRTRALLNPLKQSFALVSLVTERYNAYRRSRHRQAPVDVSAPDEIRGALSLCTSAADPAFVESFRLNRILLERVAASCAERGIPFGLVCCPWAYRSGDIERFRAIEPTFDPDFFETELAALARDTGMRFLGLQTAFRERYEREGVDLAWGHWNYEGHRFVAALVVDHLRTAFPLQP